MKTSDPYDTALPMPPSPVNTGHPTHILSACVVVRIPFHDLDPAGFVWHGRYFKYFEQARSKLLKSVGYGYLEMKESGFLWPVVESQVRYLKPLTLDQEIRVTAMLEEWEYRLVFHYHVENELGEMCARANTVQVPIDAKTLEMQIGSPDILLRRVARRLEQEDSPENDQP